MQLTFTSWMKLTATFFALAICQEASATGNQRVEVPITIDGPRVIAMVSVGSSAPVPVVVDTGAQGLRLRSEHLKPTDYRRTGKKNKVMYIGHNGLDGEIAMGSVKLGDFTIPGEASFQVIDKVICPHDQEDCKGFAAKYAGTLGIGIFKRGEKKHNPPLLNPLIENEPLIYILHLPKPGEKDGALIINPTPQERARFVKMKLLQNFADAIPVCIGRYCLAAVLDAGAPGNNINYPSPRELKATGLALDGEMVAEGTQVPIEFGGSTGLTQIFTAGKGVSHFKVTHKNKESVLLGINTFRYLDVLYNFQAGVIGVAAKE